MQWIQFTNMFLIYLIKQIVGQLVNYIKAKDKGPKFNKVLIDVST